MAYLSRCFSAVLCLASVTIAFAAESSPPGSSSPRSGTAGLPGEAQPDSTQAKVVPPLPGTKTAADTFRELLAMTPDDRTRALAAYSAPRRKHLEEGLREYENLSVQEREDRLRQLDLKSHLIVLMKLPAANRPQRLKVVPPDLLPVIEERLREWDRLPADVRQKVLEYDSTTSYFLRVKNARPGVSSGLLPGGFPPNPALASYSSNATDPFREFIQLPSREQQKTLESLPAWERAEMEKTLKTFSSLSPEVQKICVDSFGKLSRMSPEQRNEFLKNAARWKAMSPRERETWRALVEILPPSPSASSPPPLALPIDASGAPVTASNAAVLPAAPK
jgi:Protein of unknown function (DUF3106)